MDRSLVKYIFPFFFWHGETHEILLEEIEAIQRSGIREFCVESQVHRKVLWKG